MASDQRWTGGTATREWTRGHPIGPVIDHPRILGDVRRYLADVAQHRQLLSAEVHPTVKSCLKFVFHSSDEEADAIRAAYAEAVLAGA
jgi:hypothetical protein